MKILDRLFSKSPAPISNKPVKRDGLRLAAARMEQEGISRRIPIQAPVLMPGIVPKGEKIQVAMDASAYEYASSAYGYGDIGGFPGYPYLAMLSLRAEYRAMVSALSTELTREWITLNSTETASDETKQKITELTQKMAELQLRQVIQNAAEQDGYFGRGQIFVDIKGADRSLPLILSSKTISRDSLLRFCTIEPMWTTPKMYNAIDPSAKDFYKPTSWWMMGQDIHSSRLLTIITRPLPDMLKPAYNFSGMSMSQLAEPYVNNWLRTRQSVSDLVNNFSIIALKTAMEQVLTGGDDGSSLFARIKLFTATRSNKGMMLLDKDREELQQIAVPLSGLPELQAQSLEHLCTVSHEPAVVLTGLSPTGLNATSEGEIKAWENWIAAQQEAFYRGRIETMLKIMQLSMYGAIDPDITFTFNPLSQMSQDKISVIQLNESTRAGNYIDRGVLDPQEVRESLARDPESGYQGIDITAEIDSPEKGEENEDHQIE